MTDKKEIWDDLGYFLDSVASLRDFMDAESEAKFRGLSDSVARGSLNTCDIPGLLHSIDDSSVTKVVRKWALYDMFSMWLTLHKTNQNLPPRFVQPDHALFRLINEMMELLNTPIERIDEARDDMMFKLACLIVSSVGSAVYQGKGEPDPEVERLFKGYDRHFNGEVSLNEDGMSILQIARHAVRHNHVDIDGDIVTFSNIHKGTVKDVYRDTKQRIVGSVLSVCDDLGEDVGRILPEHVRPLMTALQDVHRGGDVHDGSVQVTVMRSVLYSCFYIYKETYIDENKPVRKYLMNAVRYYLGVNLGEEGGGFWHNSDGGFRRYPLDTDEGVKQFRNDTWNLGIRTNGMVYLIFAPYITAKAARIYLSLGGSVPEEPDNRLIELDEEANEKYWDDKNKAFWDVITGNHGSE